MATGGALIGALRVTLGLDSAQFESGSKRARQTAQRDAAAIQKSLDGLKGRLDTLYAGVAGSAILAAGKRALDYASSLGEVAQQAGVSAKELQEYRYAASQAGVSSEQMDGALTKLTKTIGEAKAGSKAQATTFRELGVAIQDANGRVYSAGEVIPKLADALAKVKDPATRARLEMELFGKTGQKLDTLLAGGSEALNNLRDAAHRLGVVLSDRQIQNADDAADKLASVKQVLEARIAGVVSDNATAIVSLADALGSLTARFIQFAQSNPEKTLGLIGAAAGALRGGPIAAGVGYVAGSAIGRQVGQSSADANMDLKFRMAELRKAKTEYAARQKAAQSGGLLSFRRTGSNLPGGTAAQAEAELRRQTVLLQQATAAAGRSSGAAVVAAGDGALPTVASTGRKSSGKGRSGPTAAEIEAKSQQELSRLRQEQLQAELSLTTDAEKRADLQSQLLLEEFNERSAQIANDEHFTVAQKAAQQAALKALYGVSGEGDNIVVGGNKNSLSAGIARDLREKLAQQAYEVQAADLNAKKDALQGQLNLARSAEDRRRIELEILDLEYQLRAAKLDQVINSQESSKAEKDLAQMAKDRLGGQQSADAANIERQNMGPMASYLDSIPQTASEVNEAFEQIAANGLANMNDQLANAAANTLKLKGLAGQLFNQLIADMIRLNLQQSMGGGGSLLGGLLKAGASLFGGASLGGVSSSSLSALDAQASAISTRNLTGLATGGTIGGFSGVDKNILSINGVATARVSANERIRVEPNSVNDNTRAPAVQISMPITFSGAMDLATKTEAIRFADAARQAAIRGVMEASRRRG